MIEEAAIKTMFPIAKYIGGAGIIGWLFKKQYDKVETQEKQISAMEVSIENTNNRLDRAENALIEMNEIKVMLGKIETRNESIKESLQKLEQAVLRNDRRN